MPAHCARCPRRLGKRAAHVKTRGHHAFLAAQNPPFFGFCTRAYLGREGAFGGDPGEGLAALGTYEKASVAALPKMSLRAPLEPPPPLPPRHTISEMRWAGGGAPPPPGGTGSSGVPHGALPLGGGGSPAAWARASSSPCCLALAASCGRHSVRFILIFSDNFSSPDETLPPGLRAGQEGTHRLGLGRPCRAPLPNHRIRSLPPLASRSSVGIRGPGHPLGLVPVAGTTAALPSPPQGES